MLPGPPLYEYRAWGDDFPGLPHPDDEAWSEETYILAKGLRSLDVKVRGDALEIKEMLADRDGTQLWNPAERLVFPIPALTLERALMVRLMIGQPLSRERYGLAEIMSDIVEARDNLVAVPLRKRRRLLEVAGCRAETTEVEIRGHRVMTACAENEAPERVLAAAREMGIDRLPNLAYPMALLPLLPRLEALDAQAASRR